MLSLRKLSSQISPRATFTLLPLFLHHHCKAANRTDTTNYESSRTVIITAKSQQIRRPFCAVAEPILVQARDPSRIALELVNAVSERRYEDAWKAYEKHMHMDGLLRKSDLNKLIIGLAESLDAHWLGRACGSVELAFESNKHELLERDSLIFLSFILARCELPVLASDVVRKLVRMEAFPPLKAWSAIIEIRKAPPKQSCTCFQFHLFSGTIFPARTSVDHLILLNTLNVALDENDQ